MAARYYGLDHFVRQPATDYASIMRSLEAGAGGVMISMVRGPEDAEQAVRWAKFHPRGDRGMNGGNRDGRFGLMPRRRVRGQGQRRDFVGIQIETASRDRLDPPRSPPSPTSTSSSSARPTSARSWASPATSRIPDASTRSSGSPEACASAGKPWGIVPRGPEYAARMQAWGCRMFVLAFDIHVVHAGIRATKERYGSFFGGR